MLLAVPLIASAQVEAPMKTDVNEVVANIDKVSENYETPIFKAPEPYQALPTQVLTPVVKTSYRASTQATTPMNESQAKQWIISKEGWITSVNKSSYACGKPQSNPCDKLLDFAGVYHSETVKPWNYTYAEAVALISQVPESVQDAWMDDYVMNRYGSYTNARSFWLAHGYY
jgi:hypothetical protein